MRTPLDQYPTPAWQTRALLRRVGIFGNILEPCCGDGAICNVLRDGTAGHARFVYTNEIDPKYAAMGHLDATQPELWSDTKVIPNGIDWTVTNPPFNVAMPILQHAHRVSKAGVVFLLRLSFMEPTEDSIRKGVKVYGRGEWLAANPPQKMIVLPRWSYNGHGTDSVTTAWFVWSNQLVKVPAIEIVTKAEIGQ